MTAPVPRLSAELAAELVHIVGESGVVTDPARLMVYESDGLTAYRCPPRAAVLPRDGGQTARAVRALVRAGVPFVPRGSGTGLSGGALATDGAVVVCTARMNRILEIDPRNRRARLQPGVVNAHLTAAALPHGLHYAPDPSSQSACSVGGNVAENSGGPHCLKYGVTSRYVRGLDVVLPDGSRTRLDRWPDAGELDLAGAFVGSEGCFGIAVEIEVELLPLPQATHTLLGIFGRLEDAGRAVTAIVADGLLPSALEIVDRATIQAVEESVFAAGYPTDAAAALVVEFDGVRAGLEAEAARAEAACLEWGAREVRTATSADARAALWKGRKKAFGAMGRIAPDLLVQDATVPRTKLPEVLAGIADVGTRHRLRVANVFHAGDGNLHPNILFDRRDADEVERVERASKEIMRICVEAGGTITGEHGVGLDKRDYMTLIHSDDVLRAMEAVRRVFDPLGLCNPGKVLPERIRDAETAVAQGTAGSRGEEDGGGGARRDDGTSPETPDSAAGRSDGGAASREGANGGIGTGRVPAEVGDARVVAPETAEELGELMARASREGWRVRCVGNATSLPPGYLDGPVDLVVSTRALGAVHAYDPDDLTLAADAGVSLAQLERVTGARGQWLPLDPPRRARRSLGGVLASGAYGPLQAKFGTPRDHVLGVTLVTGDGRVLELGGRVVKNVAGYDLVKLAVGSEGRLGIVTSATVRLHPLPARDVTLLYDAPRLALAAVLARSLATASLRIPALELRAGRGPEATVAVRLLGSREAVEESERLLSERVGREATRRLEGEASAEWFAALERFEDDAAAVARVGHLPSRLGELVEMCAEYGTTAAHVSLGSVRVAVGAGGRTDGEEADPADLADALARLRDGAARAGAAFRVTRTDLPRWPGIEPEPPPRASALARGIVDSFDPAGVLARPHARARG